MVSDYGPGIDAEGAFQKAFKEAGGEIVGSVRMPVANPDFSAFVQRAKISIRNRSLCSFLGRAHGGAWQDSLLNAALTPRR